MNVKSISANLAHIFSWWKSFEKNSFEACFNFNLIIVCESHCCKKKELQCYKRNNHCMPPNTYLVGDVQLFTCLEPLNFVTRHVIVAHPCFSHAEAHAVHQKPQSYEVVPEIWSQTGFFVILDHFLPFYPSSLPLTAQKTKILKKRKKYLEISSF